MGDLNLKTDISSVRAILFTSMFMLLVLQISNSAWHSVHSLRIYIRLWLRSLIFENKELKKNKKIKYLTNVDLGGGGGGGGRDLVP